MIKKLYYSNNFYTRSGLYAILSLVAAALSYAVYPVLVHILPREAFGDVAASLALANQLASVFLAFNVASLYLAKKYKDSREQLEYLQRQIVKIFLALSLFLFAVSPFLMDVLQFHDFKSFIAVTLLLLLTVPSVVWVGYLQGKEEMTRVGMYTLLSASFKFIFAVSIALLTSAEWVVFGIVAGQLVGLILLAVLPGHSVPSLLSTFSPKVHLNNKENKIGLYLFVCVVACGLMSFAQNADILYAKSLLQPYTSGTYVAISSLSNVMFYLGILLVWIALSGLHTKQNKKNYRLVARTLGLTSAIFLGMLVVFFLLEDFILQTLIGQVSSEYNHQILKNTGYQFIVTVSTLIIFTSLAIRKLLPLLQSVVFIVPILSVPLLYTGNEPNQLANRMLLSAVLGLCMQCIILGLQRYTRK